VVDDHGRLTPIAVYDGSDWWNRWPWQAESDEIRNLPLPVSLASIPAAWLPPGVRFPVSWRALSPGGKSSAFRALVPDRIPDFTMMDTIVVRTTYTGSGVEGSNGDGDTLAIAGPGTLGRITMAAADEEAALRRQLNVRVVALEADAIAHWKEEFLANGGPPADTALTRIYEVGDAAGVRYVEAPPADGERFDVEKADAPAGRTMYHLRREKLFTFRRGDECMLNLATDGFVLTSAGKIVSEKMTAHAYGGYCGDPAEMTFPLGTVTIGGHMWWIVKDSLEDGYDFSLTDTATGESVEIKGRWDLRQSGQIPAGR